jgi:hypothetical protein
MAGAADPITKRHQASLPATRPSIIVSGRQKSQRKKDTYVILHTKNGYFYPRSSIGFRN